MIYKFVQPIYYVFEVEAESLDEAYKKTGDLEADDWVDSYVGEWSNIDE